MPRPWRHRTSPPQSSPTLDPERTRRDRGAAMVEFVFVSIPLIMIVFAIIWFGLALNIKQDLTRAAAEGARVGAVALPDQDRHQIALDATDNAVSGFLAGGCNRVEGDVECEVQGPSAALCDNGQGECIKVTIRYSGSLAGNSVPFVGQAIPDSLSASSVVRVNDPTG